VPSPAGTSAAVHLPGGDLIFVPSEPASIGLRSDSLRWDVAGGQLSLLARPSMHVWSAVGLDNGLVLLAGGPGSPKWLAIWDPSNATLVPVGTSAGFAPSLIRLADGRVLVVGGLQDAEVHAGSMAPAISTVQIFQ
jgi:hypothetical protein